MPKEDDPCKHAYPTPAQCPICSAEPARSEKFVVVYITEGGDAYHFNPNCTALSYGQDLVRERGGTPAPIQTTYEHLVKGERGACRTCRPKKGT
jgi:hypothetical protein